MRDQPKQKSKKLKPAVEQSALAAKAARKSALFSGFTDKSGEHGFLTLFLIIVIITIIRLFYLQYSWFSTGLFFDEAQYWTWSKNLDLGYYSKPPFIAWLIYLTTNICGDETFCIRISAPILHGITALFVFLSAELLFDKRTAFWSGITYLTLPGISFSSVFISTDAPLMFFWCISFYFFVRSVNDEYGNKWWLITGIFCGLGLMSKYTMIIFIPSAALYLLLTKALRDYLFRLPFIVFVALSLVIFSPNLFWNFNHDFVSFSHTRDNVVTLAPSLYPIEALEFIVGQYGVFGPILFTIFLLLLLRTPKFLKEDETKILLCFSVPLFLAGLAVSLISSAQAHWSGPAYISGTILVVKYLLQHNKKLLLTSSVILHIIVAIIFYHSHYIFSSAQTKYNPLTRLEKWAVISKGVQEELAKYPQTYLLSDERKLVATLIYNLRTPVKPCISGTDKLNDNFNFCHKAKPYPVLKWNPSGKIQDYYDMTTGNLTPYKGANFLFVTRSIGLDKFANYFTNVTKIKTIKISEKENYYIYHLKLI